MFFAGLLSGGLHGALIVFPHVEKARRINSRVFEKGFTIVMVAAMIVFILKSIFYLLFDFGVISQWGDIMEDAIPSAIIFGFAVAAAIICIVLRLTEKEKPFRISLVIYCILAVFFDLWTLCWQAGYSMSA